MILFLDLRRAKLRQFTEFAVKQQIKKVQILYIYCPFLCPFCAENPGAHALEHGRRSRKKLQRRAGQPGGFLGFAPRFKNRRPSTPLASARDSPRPLNALKLAQKKSANSTTEIGHQSR
jgi:hypothetical protein